MDRRATTTGHETQESLTDPSSGNVSDGGPIHLETANERGQQVTVVRDSEGHIVFPSGIPPATRSPTSPEPSDLLRAPSTSSLSPTNTAQNPSPGGQPLYKYTTTPASPHSSTGKTPCTTPFDPESGHRDMTSTESSDRLSKPRAQTLPDLKAKQAQQTTSRLGDGAAKEDTSSSSESSSDEEGDEEHRGRSHVHRKKHEPSDDRFRRFKIGNDHYRTRGKVSKRDGRLSISVKDTSNTGYLAKALGTAAKRVVPLKKDSDRDDTEKPDPSKVSPTLQTSGPDTFRCPKLNIVIMVIGSRGDAQPFLKIGKVLKEQYGHRVRIATHPAFRDFVEKDSGLEFFSVGGDPSELMAFMVKNPGMIPTLETVKAGDIGRRRAAMAEMFDGFWRACINATDDERDDRNRKMMSEKDPFVADAIIANPPSFAHVHCAEALGIPLHLMFTFPYTPTQAFPHPLASIKKSNVDPGYTNFISYPLVEMMVWQGLGDLINDFRVKTLGLDPVSTLWAPGATYRLHVPFTYMWSPGLVPKPEDWGEEVDISGFVFLDLAASFKCPDPLAKFLDAGEPPIYIGFGSIVVDDANRFTDMIFEAVKLAGVRALVSKGWGGLGSDSLDVPENIFLLDNVPHDWLFPKVRAVVIHGGAGTTAIALKCGLPTMIVPFFGDQHFWGTMVGSSGAGPEPVPYKNLDAEKLAEGIKYLLTDEAVEAAGKIAKRIGAEGNGAENACISFHKHLALSGKNSMRCSILADKVAVWQLKNTNLRLSTLAAYYVVEKGYVSVKKLRLLRHNEWNDFEGPGEPVTGIAGSLVSSVGNVFGGIGGVPYRVAKNKNERKEKKEKKKERREKRRADATAAKEAALDGDQQPSRSPPATTEAANHAEDTRESGSDQEGDETDPPPLTQKTSQNSLRRRDTQMTVSTVDVEHPAEEFVQEVGRGAAQSAKAIARVPVDLSLALAQGFHNAPRLYGDDTVRRPKRVTGIKSGLKAAGYEFVYGIYDGWTGLVRLPVRGARDSGVRGFVTGIGMGLTGFVLKDIAAVFGPVGYTLKGIVKQAERGQQPIQRIRRARVIEGERELKALSQEEKVTRGQEVVEGWKVMEDLWRALELQEKEKGGLQGRLRARKRGKRSLGAAFESVETAKKALAALMRGERVETIIGTDRGRVSEDQGKSSSAAHNAALKEEKELKKAASVNGGKSLHGGKPANGTKIVNGAGEEARGRGSTDKRKSFQLKCNVHKEKIFRSDESTTTTESGTIVPEGRPNKLCDKTCGILEETDGETPGAERENPFSTKHRDIEKNIEDNRQTLAMANDTA
ncbi:CHIP6 protein [Lasiosphaeria hispida]|uniref:CHIP6 protein n=1 Tax=Lasiosphaeria hispida TaxID=260671 RepID=A0AAJ0HMG0_9PEZI|nr:CHIP6 protein [Lasiosphaeria hispida]